MPRALARPAGRFPGRGKGHIMIRMLVDRCHVYDSNRRMIRYVVSRMRAPAWRTWMAVPRAVRHQALRQAIGIHAENRQLYRDVMRGGV